jgi:saccharopine dehydrogenase-like NADP-dependent oxidoreductase
VTAVVDCGVAPGLSNMMCGAAAARLDPLESVEIYVGGLPAERHWPFDYKAGFAPWDVLEEYTRPARIVEHGQIVLKEPLSEPELLEFPGVGTLEAFNTDGLRSLAYTLKAPFMKEKTLRWPGHAELMRVPGHRLLLARSSTWREGAAARRHRRAPLPEVDLRGG